MTYGLPWKDSDDTDRLIRHDEATLDFKCCLLLFIEARKSNPTPRYNIVVRSICNEPDWQNWRNGLTLDL